MTIQLPEDLERFIEAQIQSGLFATHDEAIAEAVRRVRRWEQEQAAEEAPTPATGPIPAWERVLETMKDLPDDAFDRVPADSSEQLDHYLYGSPRRPAP